jgi:predicted aspartyl protease
MLLATLAAVLVAGCEVSGEPGSTSAPATREDGAIPLRFVGAQDAAMVVPVHINGEGPFDLVLDTGATFTCVTPEVAERLQLPEERGAVGIGAGVHAAGRVGIVRFDSLRVGAAAATDMPGCVLDLSALQAVGTEVDGLLGLNFLRSFDVHLDFGRDVLALTARE